MLFQLFASFFVAFFAVAHGHVQPGMASLQNTSGCTLSSNSPDFMSYHVHVLFWQNNEKSTNDAMQLRVEFMKEFGLDGPSSVCTFSPGDPQPDRDTICAFGVDSVPAGPFTTAQYSFFVPTSYFQKASAWTLRKRNLLDVFIHPNTGCGLQDHIHHGTWAGHIWPLDPSPFLPVV
jgi:aromatic ring-cleaving dioxygenase